MVFWCVVGMDALGGEMMDEETVCGSSSPVESGLLSAAEAEVLAPTIYKCSLENSRIRG